LAVSYGWSEEVIFNLPWDRAKAYLDEIMLYHEKPVVRRLPQLPEELKLQELMQQMVSIRKAKRTGNGQ
jgi:hypothetical protein